MRIGENRRSRPTSGGSDEEDAARPDVLGDPPAYGGDVPDLGGARERCPPRGPPGPAHVEGDGGVPPPRDALRHPPQQALHAAEDGVGVHEHHRHVPRRLRLLPGRGGLEDPHAQLRAVPRLHRRPLHLRPAQSTSVQLSKLPALPVSI